MALRRSSTPALASSVIMVLAVVATILAGLPAVLALCALGLALALLSRPEWALGFVVGLTILIESAPEFGPSPELARVYLLIPGTKVSPLELLLVLALLAVVLERRVSGFPLRSPGLLSAPLALLGLALLMGAVTGKEAGVGVVTLVNGVRSCLPLLILPLIVVQVVGRRVELRTVLVALLVMAALKGALGLAALFTGQTASGVGEDALTYYEAPANALGMFALLFCVGAAVRRVRLPTWAWATVPVILGCLTLSYRRSFWIATVLGVLLVVLFAVGRESRRLGLPALVGVVAAVALAMSSSGGGSGSLLPVPSQDKSGISGRLASLNPTSIAASRDDRYRTGERKNVLAALREEPVAGLGFGIGYPRRYPLSIGDISNEYVHVAALWWWMRTGILGLIGYIGLMALAAFVGLRVFRLHPDPIVGVAGLAAAAGFVGFAVAETTATFTGPDPRSSVLMGVFVGLLAVAHREALSAPRSAAPR